jgi:hypothetical protein
MRRLLLFRNLMAFSSTQWFAHADSWSEPSSPLTLSYLNTRVSLSLDLLFFMAALFGYVTLHPVLQAPSVQNPSHTSVLWTAVLQC